MSFGVMNEDDDSPAGISEYVVFDPSVSTFLSKSVQKIEEESFNGRISICMNIYKDLCGIHFPGGSSVPSNILKSLITFCGMKAEEITKNLRNYLKHVQSNTLDLYRKDGKIEFDLQSDIDKILNVEAADEVSSADEDIEIEDSDMRMKFNQMTLDDGEMDREDFNELEQAINE